MAYRRSNVPWRTRCCDRASTLPYDGANDGLSRPHRLHRGRRPSDPRSAIRASFELRYACGHVRFRCRVHGVSEARRAGLPDSRMWSFRTSTDWICKARSRREAPADRVHHGTRRHTLFGARDQGRRGRLSDQAVQGGGPDARDQCRPRAEIATARRKRAELADLQQRLSSLTPREREVLPLVVERPSQQAGCGRARHQRDHAPDSSRQDHEEDGSRIACRTGANGRDARDTDDPVPAFAQMTVATCDRGQPAAGAGLPACKVN